MTTISFDWRPRVAGLGDRLGELASSSRATPTVIRRVVVAILFFAIVQSVFHLSTPELVSGLSLGGLYGIVGVALVLTYRTSRVINFAAAAVGAVPAITAVLLSTA